MPRKSSIQTRIKIKNLLIPTSKREKRNKTLATTNRWHKSHQKIVSDLIEMNHVYQALSYACVVENTSIMKELLERDDVDINMLDADGKTLLHWACEYGLEKSSDFLLSKYRDVINVNTSDRTCGNTPLICASSNNPAAAQLLLLRDDLDVNHCNHFGSNALISACKHGKTDVVKMLLDYHDIDVNHNDKKSRSALLHACKNLHNDIAQLLVNRDDIEVSINDVKGKNVLHYLNQLNLNEHTKQLLIEKMYSTVFQ